MLIRLYFDEDSMRRSLVRALRARGVDVITALDAGMIEREDAEHLDYATEQRPRLVYFQRGGLLSSTQRLFGPGQATRWNHPYASAVLFDRGADASHTQVGGEQIRRRNEKLGRVPECVGLNVKGQEG